MIHDICEFHFFKFVSEKKANKTNAVLRPMYTV